MVTDWTSCLIARGHDVGVALVLASWRWSASLPREGVSQSMSPHPKRILYHRHLEYVVWVWSPVAHDGAPILTVLVWSARP